MVNRKARAPLINLVNKVKRNKWYKNYNNLSEYHYELLTDPVHFYVEKIAMGKLIYKSIWGIFFIALNRLLFLQRIGAITLGKKLKNFLVKKINYYCPHVK